ncbi:MAG: hypothetical protein HS117_05095 [Verrucomicrobiaceae bacterium]|nr:hypothetical protein [Verrucomicrobiaceae bacterium]
MCTRTSGGASIIAHHGIEKEAIDVNFAIHYPLLNRIFGTHRMPAGNRWPEGYGIGGHPVSKGYWKQFLNPFQRREEPAVPPPVV